MHSRSLHLTRFINIATIAVLIAAPTVRSQDATTIRITGKVLVPKVERLGVHFGGHNYYDSVILKQRVAENFEGTIHRIHLIGPAQKEAQVFSPWNAIDDDATDDWTGATYTVLSGPDAGQRGKVVGFEKRPDVKKGDTQVNAVKLDRPRAWNKDLNGLLLERLDTKAGQNPWMSAKTVKDASGAKKREVAVDTRWISEHNELVSGDTPPGSFGSTSMNLKGAEKPAKIEFRAQFNSAAPIEGKWRLRFWARAKSGAPKLTVKPTADAETLTIVPGAQWQKHEQTMAIKPPEDGKQLLMFVFTSKGGDTLIDDVEIWQDSGDKNPTPFRDTLVDALKELNPGSMRYLRNTRNTLLNSLMPAIRTYSMGGGKRDDFGAHEFFELCEYLQCGAWPTLPGTMQPEEIDQFMEYIGAPADTGLGKLRAELGHPEPFTKTLPAIHVQFGNEVVTFMGTGYWGPDYWRGMIERAQKSPYYSDNVIFTVNEQGAGAARILDWTPNADRLCINSYLIFGVYKDQIEMARDKPGFYDFVFASSWHLWNVNDNNKAIPGALAAQERKKEICIYEGGNYHTTFGTPPDPPVEQVNRMITGHAGGLSATHNSLILLKKFGARTIESFNLSQHSFSPGGAFGNMPKPVRVWGGVLNIGDPAKRRFRPRFLALQVANQVMGGDLVETVHSGADPRIKVTNKFGAGYGPSRAPKEMTIEMPLICSYAFAEGRRRGLILVSQDTRNAQPITLELDKPAAGAKARSWLLASDDLEATNENDWAPDAPQVTIREAPISDFRSGYHLSLPKSSMMAIEWDTP